jgi:hypothetical protein
LADRTGDNEALIVNSANCNDFDGVSNANNNQTGQYCCSEWMKY